nr:hypothetical protein [uncultured Porphyromonas sp.]
MIDIEQKRRELSYYCLADTMGLLPLDLYAEVESMYSPNFYQWLFDDNTLPPGRLPDHLAPEYQRFLDYLRLHPHPSIK